MTFSTDWLALRRDADNRARDSDLTEALARHFVHRTRVTVVDIGAGTGANMAATASVLPRPQHWRLIDHDARLLRQARPPEGVTIEPVVADLAGTLDPIFEPDPDLVTASAFFDLVGAAWIDGFVAALAASGAAFHALLSYDGREDWQGDHPADDAVLEAFHADQRQDKGLGLALGPDAHPYLARRLAESGYQVSEGTSDWRLEAPRDRALIRALAGSTGAAAASRIGVQADEWAVARDGAQTVIIGHKDLLALPRL